MDNIKNLSLVEINIDAIEKTLSNFLCIDNFNSMESFFNYQVVVDSVIRDLKTGALIINDGSKVGIKRMESARSILSKQFNLSEIDKKNQERNLFLRSVSSNLTNKFSKIKKAYLDIILDFKDRNKMDYLEFKQPSSLRINHAKLVDDNYDLNEVDHSLNSLALALDVYNQRNLFSVQDFYVADIAMYDVFFSDEAWSVSVSSFVAMNNLYNKFKSNNNSSSTVDDNINDEQQLNSLDFEVSKQRNFNNNTNENDNGVDDNNSISESINEQSDHESIVNMDILYNEESDDDKSCLFDTDGDLLCGVTNKYEESGSFSKTDKSNQRLQQRFEKYKNKGNFKIFFSKSFQPKKDSIFNNDDFYKYINYRDSFFKYIENGSFKNEIFFKNLNTNFQTNCIDFKYCIFLNKDLSFDQFRKFRNVMINFNKTISF